MNIAAHNFSVNMVEVGQRIRLLRKEKGISVHRLECFFGITPQAIYKWERGETIPETQNLVALSRLLGITVDELLVGKDYPIAA